MTESPRSSSAGRTLTLIIVGLSMVSALTIFLRICITALLPDIEASMNITATQASLLGSAVLLGYGIMQIPAGILTDALGARRMLMMFLFLAGLGTLFVAATNALPVAVAGRFVTGMALSVYPAIVAILALCVPAERFASAMGVVFSATAFGVIFGGTPLALLNQAVGWKVSLFLCGGLTFALMLLLGYLIKKPAPSAVPRPPLSTAAMKNDLLQVFRTKEFWPLVLWQMVVPGTFFVLAASWWTKYFILTGSLTKLEAGHIFMAQSIAGIFTLPLCGVISDKIRSRKKVIVGISVLGLAASLSYVLLAGKLGFVGLLLQAIVFATGTSAAASCFLATVKETFPSRLLGTATGCCNMLYPIYAAAMTVVFGLLVSSKTSALTAAGLDQNAVGVGAYGFACWALVIGSAAGLVFSLLIKESYGNAAEGSAHGGGPGAH